MEINKDDIAHVAHIMQKDFSDDERIHVIQLMESGDVNACPGSGKTTTMVAKLLILAEKLIGTMVGICALSHTNAAKNEIKRSLGVHSHLVMRYPHFVGTIQVFVDQFLAIPAYIEEFGRRPVAIDDDLYESVSSRYYSRISSGSRFALNRQTRDAGKETFCNTCYGYENFQLVMFDSNRETNYCCRPITPTYQEVLRCKQEISALGYLTYHDAFAYANRYLTKYPYLASIISNRFPFVFVDEMQDTDLYQNDLLERIFNGRSVIQKFGDPHQAIYGQRCQEGKSVWRPSDNHAIRSSRRLSQSISRLSQGICSQPTEIHGNDQIPDQSHTVIIFDERTKQNVIPEFGQIIERENLTLGPFKAVGAIGRPNQDPQKLSISSYWSQFHRRQQSQSHNQFWTLISQAAYSIYLRKNYSEASQLMTRAFTEVLRSQQLLTQNKTIYTPTQLVKSIKESGEENFTEFKGILLSNCESLLSTGNLDIDLTIAQGRRIFGFLGLRMDRQVVSMFQERDQDVQPAEPVIGINTNIYYHKPEIPVEIDTIHSVKGQTHQATLVLETFFYQNDLQTVFPYLVGKYKPRAGDRILYRFLGMVQKHSELD